MLLRILKIYIASNLLIATATLAMVWVSCIWLHLPLLHSPLLLIQVFFSTWFIYQLSRYIYFQEGIYADKNELVAQSFRRYPKLNFWSIVLSGLLSVVAFFFLQISTKYWLIIAGLISVLYSAPVGKIWGSALRLRDIPLAKILFIAIVWTITSVILPVAEYGISFSERREILVLAVLQFVFILFITLPFDIHDEPIDRKSGLKTVPVLFGIRFSKWLCLGLGIVHAFGVIYLFMLENWRSISAIYLSEIGILSVLLMTVLLQLFTFFKANKTEKWIIKLVYDGSMILYFVIMILTCKTA